MELHCATKPVCLLWLTPEIVDLRKKNAPKLIITVDNGISSIAEK
jgi:single-stranded DNA-specific DHH superfamily exonuclease